MRREWEQMSLGQLGIRICSELSDEIGGVIYQYASVNYATTMKLSA